MTYHYITETYTSSGECRAYYEVSATPLQVTELSPRVDTYRTLYDTKAAALAVLPEIIRAVRDA